MLPVNKSHREVQGLPAYPELSSCPVVPDLVFVCVPAGQVASVVAEAGEIGTSAACVISAGFAEVGAEGASLQRALVAEAEAKGVRLVGPNCTGIFTTTAGVRFNATFSRTVPPPGRTSLLSQSGALGVAVLEAAEARGIGIGAFVSVGNSADVTCNELLEYWSEDPDTDLVLVYLESIPDPARFVRICRKLTSSVPVVAVKAGRTKAGRRGASSHTAALSGGDAAVEALLSQAGVIRAASTEEMLDLATVLGAQRRFKGPRVAIVTNGGGPGVLAADACESNGLVVPELSQATADKLRRLLPAQASVRNPVDMIASATASQYGEVVRALGAAAEIDGQIVLFNTPLLTTATDVATELLNARRELAEDAALVAVFMNRDGPPRLLAEAGIASFVFPENAARALGRSIAWMTRSLRPARGTSRLDVDLDKVRQLLDKARPQTPEGWLATVDAEALVEAYGIAVPRSVLVRSAGEAEAAQGEIGGTVVVKLATAVHKSDIGGVRVGVATPAAAADAVRAIRADLAAAGRAGLGRELLVQEQVPSGQEMIIGIDRDRLLGPLVMVGFGGTLVELLGDVALGLAPLTDDDIDDMLSSLRAYGLLTGYRGAPRSDLEALRDVLRRVSALADDLPEVVEMDLNPLFVMARGALAVDVRVRLAGRDGSVD